MKINGPGQPSAPGVPGQGAPEGPAGGQPGGAAGGVAPSGGVPSVEKTQKSGKSFAETVAGVAPARAAAAPSVARANGISVSDLVADLRAGKLDARAAVDKVIDRVLGAQLGPQTPAHVRDKVQAALRDAVEDDPLLAEKIRGLI